MVCRAVQPQWWAMRTPKWLTLLFVNSFVTKEENECVCLSELQTTGVECKYFRKGRDRNQGYWKPFMKVSAMTKESFVWNVPAKSSGLSHTINGNGSVNLWLEHFLCSWHERISDFCRLNCENWHLLPSIIWFPKSRLISHLQTWAPVNSFHVKYSQMCCRQCGQKKKWLILSAITIWLASFMGR